MPRPNASPRSAYVLDSSLEFMRLLWSIEHNLQRMSKRMKREMGITVPQRLVTRGYLERTSDPGDSRRARLRLKPSGVRHTRIAAGTVERAVASALERTGAPNVRAAQKVLAEIARSLDQA